MPVSIFLSREPAPEPAAPRGTAAQPAGERVLILDDLLCAWRDARDRARVLKVSYFVDRALSAAEAADERGYLHQLADDVVAYLGAPTTPTRPPAPPPRRPRRPRRAARGRRVAGALAGRRAASPAPGAASAAAPAGAPAAALAPVGAAASPVAGASGARAALTPMLPADTPAPAGKHQPAASSLSEDAAARHEAQAPADEPARVARADAPAPAAHHLRVVELADGPGVKEV